MKRIFTTLVLLVSTLCILEAGESNSTNSTADIIQNNLSEIAKQVSNVIPLKNQFSEADKAIEMLLARKAKLDDELKNNNVWAKIYSNYHTYLYLQKQKEMISANITVLEKKKRLSDEQQKELEANRENIATIDGKLELLSEYKKDPFSELVKPTTIEEAPAVENPLSIIAALSYQKILTGHQDEYNERYQSLKEVVSKVQEENRILNELLKKDVNNSSYISELEEIDRKLKTYAPILEIFETTQNVYSKKIDEIKLKLKQDIKKEIEKSATIGGILLFFLLLFLLGKYLARRYMAENDRFYTINKILNITFITFFVLTLLFGYIENVSYIVTVLGFASAGIAIAMKDWFMSVLGWFVIVIGGSIHVGDRVKFTRGGIEYIGDIVDISMLRMTIHEDVTLTTYMHNRRGGRMIFVPNNYIFTDMIANYSHAGLKTVWDGIDFVVTFDSDIQKATAIAKEVTKKYSKGYTDITRKQLNKLRSSYSIRNTNVEPRILAFIEPYGVKISAWYLTNSYATLTLRSTISMEILEKIQLEENVKMAFPTQSIYHDRDVPKPGSNSGENITLGAKEVS